MNERVAFTYTVLRYCHDITTGEFVNAGVVVCCEERGFVGGAFGAPVHRLKATFPGLDEWAVQKMIDAVAASVRLSQAEAAHRGVLSGKSAIDFATAALPKDDSSLQWSPLGSGIAKDPQKALDDLFARFVGRHSDGQGSVRHDEDVLRTFRDQLQRAKVLSRLSEGYEVAVGHDSLRFPYALVGTAHHCLLPLSFDLASAEDIKAKAYRVLGQLQSVSSSSAPVRIHLLVGMPSYRPALRDIAVRALSTICKVSLTVEVEYEANADSFASALATIASRDKARVSQLRGLH